MSPEQRSAAQARCAKLTVSIDTLDRRDLAAALDALDAADRRIAELETLVHRLAERVHSQSEKLGRRAEKPSVQ
jgi:hypothetical protein